MIKMDPEEEHLQLTMIQEPNINIYKLLLNSLQHNHYAIFKSLLKRELEKRPSSIEIDYIYPHPLNKTLLDISCLEGLPEFTELLLELGADPNKINFSYNRGPLHFATESGHVNVLKVLLEDPRSNPNLEVARETALHLAVRKNNPDCAKVLLDNNASPNIPNSKGMTPIHVAASESNREMVLAILNHSRLPPDLDNFYDFRKKTARDLIIQKFPDIHLPPKMPKRVDYNILRFYLDANDEKNFLNHLDMVEDDADIDQERLITLAAEKNLITSVQALIKDIDPIKTPIVDEAVEVAVRKGHVEILAELLNLGVKIKDNLILVAARELGVSLRANLNQNNRLKCLKMILELPNINVRCRDEKGNTPLHYAARAECEEAVVLLLQHGSYLGAENCLGVSPLAHIAPGLLQDYFNDCLRSNNDRTDDYEIEFNYECFIPHTDFQTSENSESSLLQNNYQTSRNSKQLFTELEPFNYIAHNRSLKNLLKHPLLSSFLYLKWHRIRYVFYINFIFFTCFYIFLNSYILLTFKPPPINQTSSENTSAQFVAEKIVLTDFSRDFNSLWGITTVLLILLAIRECFQLFSAPIHYIKNAENWWELLLIILTSIILIHPHSGIGAVLILLSAWELIILIGQHPKMSTGIEIFKTVTVNLLFFLLPYAFLILAFALSFFTLFNDSDDDNFPNAGRSVFKTIIMLTGEFDANDIPFLKYPIISRFIFILFIFLIAIVLFNLLIGLAVSDTSDILNKSELVVLISRTKLINYSEKIVIGSKIIKSIFHCRYFNADQFKNYSIGFLASKIFFFPSFMPTGKIYVQPYKNNLIRIVGNNLHEKSCDKILMDKKIVVKAKEILAEKGKISEYQKIIDDLREIKMKMEKIENIVNHIQADSLKNNTTNVED
ncbi:transient receptor potential cation channel protein painless [Chelonus insularis]|uniref:transient receptor potential cation channel protein painless n=1 Tax=Chelonus insularis TaxID=460826 RepID=UPI0015890BAA|nr:transient receptor potential cation channel protein painless-like [Chelonus insularis]XP_034952764.1 transient receptor potential cation channel protein painless-like [Chelonus insularis]